ncbi:MAG: hypothetical protein GY696_24870 [Gammaproteobacteria bacterium]|nr:hypothetical protein [Gammaproteobacteria bacterium]
MRHINSLLSLVITILLISPATAFAENSKQELLDELRTLSEKARHERAADRWLQNALEELVDQYSQPEQKLLLLDDFQDGDYTNTPQWHVLSGEFSVESGVGLRSRVDPNFIASTPPPKQKKKTTSKEEAVAGLLADILLGPSKRADQPNPEPVEAEPTSDPTQPAKIMLTTSIPNAFIIETRFTLNETSDEARIELDLFQEESEQYGYHLYIKTGRRGYIELERVRNQKSVVIEGQNLASNLSDGSPHKLIWQQNDEGAISLTLDDQLLFEVRDKAFRDDYKNLSFTNRSGDLQVHEVSISG